MADLYFKVKADYGELVKMQQEVNRLKGELSDFSGSRSEFFKLQKRISDLSDKIVDLSEHAAKDFVKSFNNISGINPDFLKDFDKEFGNFSNNMIKGIEDIEKQYDSMLREIASKHISLGKIEGTENERHRLQELRGEINAQIDTLKLAKEVWRGTFDQAGQGIEALLPKLKGLIPEDLFSRLEKSGIEQIIIQTAKAVDDLTLKLEKAKDVSLQELINQSKALRQQYEELSARSKEAGAIGEQSYVDYNLKNVENIMPTKIQEALDSAREALKGMGIDTSEYNEQLRLIEQLREQYFKWRDAIKEVGAVSNEEAQKDSQAKVEQLVQLQKLLETEEKRAEVLRKQAIQAYDERDASKPSTLSNISSALTGDTRAKDEYAVNTAVAQEVGRLAEESQAKVDGLRSKVDELTASFTEEERAQLAAMQAPERVQTAQRLQEEIASEEKKLEILKQQAEEKKKSLGERIIEGAATALAPEIMAQGKEAEKNALIEEQKRKIDELKTSYEDFVRAQDSSVQKQIAEANATKENQRAREEYIAKLRETKEAATSTDSTVQNVLKEGSAALKALEVSSLKEGFQSANQSLKETEAELQKALATYQQANAELNQLEGKMLKGDTSVSQEQVEQARTRVEETKTALTETANKYDEINAQVQVYGQQLNEVAGHHVRMRTQIMNAREEMMQMIAAGQQGTVAFQQLAIKAGDMRRQMNLANATMQYFANPTRHLAALKTGLQGVAGAAGLVTGAVGLFNSESKKMQEIQTKVQSVMAIVVGLETTYNTIKQSSTFMLALQEIKTWALAGARTAEATATEGATVAQEGLNAAMAANPIGAVLVAVTTVAAAIWGLCSALSGASEAAKKAGEEQAEMANTMRKAHEDAARTIVDEVQKYKNLKASYEEAKAKGENLDKWVRTHKKGMDEVGLSVKNATQAESTFVKNSDNVGKALIARAKYAAYAALEMELLRKEIALILASETGNFSEFDKAVKVGDKIDRSKAERLGLNTSMFGSGTYEIETEEEAEKVNRALLKEEINRVRGMRGEAQIRKGQEGVKFEEARMAGASTVKSDQERRQDKQTNKEPKNKSNSNKNKKDKKGREEHHQNDEWQRREDELKNEIAQREAQRKFEMDYERRVEQERINLMNEGTAKRLKQEELNHKKEIDAIKERYKQRIQTIIAKEKKEFDDHENELLKKNKKYQKLHYYESDKYKAHFENNDPKGKLKEIEEDKAYQEMEIELSDLKFERNRTKMYRDYLGKSEKFYDDLFKIEMNYYNEREKLKDDVEAGFLSPAEYNSAVTELERKRDKETKEHDLKEFKDSPLYASAMADGLVDDDTIEEFKTKMEELMNEAAKEMSPSDFKAFADLYNKMSDKLIETDPFGTLKASIEEYKKAQEDVTTAESELAKVRTEYYGTTKENTTSLIDQLKAERDEAYKIWTGWNESLRSLPQDGSIDEKELENRRTKEANSLAYLNSAEAKYKEALDKVKRSEEKVINAQLKRDNAQKKVTKSLKKSAALVSELGQAFASLANDVSQPVGQVLTSVTNLITSTIDGIGKIKEASVKTTDAMKKVGQAVTKAVAILAIIQAAWQVINTIMELFQGEDTEQKRIDLLESKIKALDYQFNKLKEDMDKAWGTEAIDAYARAVDALTEKQKTSMEVIQAKAGKSKGGFMGIGGHHSLEYQMNKIIGSNALGGITNAELEAAKRVLQSLGVDTSKGNLLDWIYQLSPENMATFLASTAGNAVAAKLGAVTSSGDYQGSDWLSDLQNYASTAKDAEDVTLAMAEKLNGISLDGLKDEFKTLVTTMTTSLNDINNSFDAFMREAMYNKLRDKYEEQVESFNEELKDLNDQYTRGEMSDEEYRKRLQALRDKWKKETREAQDEYQAQLTAAGVNAEDVEQSSTSGGFEAMSEDTATELNGRFASMQAMETVTAEGITQLVGMQTNIVSIADEIRNVQVNSYLELQAISENTRKMVNPILEIQDNVKLIKENTDKL